MTLKPFPSPWPVEKLSSMKLVPGAKKVGGGGAEIEDRSAYITSQIGIQLLFAHLIPMCFSAEQVNGNYGYWWFLSLTYHIHSYCGGFISMYVPHFHWDILGQVITSVLTNCESFSRKMWVMGRSKQLLQLLDE